MNARWIVVAGALSVTAFALPAAGADDQMKLATDKGCTACHSVDKKVVGPSYKDVSKKYKGDAKAPAMLADKVIKGGQGTWGPIPMPPNKVTDDEANKLVAWILAL